jgi:hypothetical protein
MKPMPDADENRRRARIETDQADRLPAGDDQDALRKSARDHEQDEHSADWRHSNLHKPN